MSKDTSEETQAPEGDIGQIPQTPLVVHAQYLKDMSFENPHAPEILQAAKTQPEMDLNLSMDVRKLENEKMEHFYEVSLNVSAKASREGKEMFIAEIIFAAAVSITGIDEKKHHPLLLTEVPYMLFPFVRQILSSATQAGGYIPLNLSPVDFRTMYLKRFANQTPEEKKDEE